jgi:hypothetical protein
VIVYRYNTAGTKTCYTAKKTWVSENSPSCGFFLTVTKGKWSVQLKGLTKGALDVGVAAKDYSNNIGGTGFSKLQPLTS